jgi:hypothetical protein
MDEDEDDGLPWWKGNPRVRFWSYLRYL